jgi:hypothetical protein
MDPNEYDGYDADNGQNVLDEDEAKSDSGRIRAENNDKAIGIVMKLAYFTLFVAVLLPLQFNAVSIDAGWRVVGTSRRQSADGSIPELKAGETIALEASSNSWNSFVCSYEWKFEHSPAVYPDSSITHVMGVNEISALPAAEVHCVNSFGVSIGTGKSLATEINLSNNN